MSLPPSEIEDLRDQARQIISSEGLSFEDLLRSSSDLVVFGSRAAGLHHTVSDLDLLIISDRSGHKKKGKLDLLYVPRTAVNSPAWRRTEIARHIGAFGISLMHNDLLIDAIADEYAAKRKQARLKRLGTSLLPCWRALSDELRIKYLTRLRRELQRYRFLNEGLPVPPTADLDSVMKLPNWFEHVFGDVRYAANMSEAGAAQLYQLMADEAQLIAGKKRTSRA